MSKNLTEILDNIIYEYNVAYESFYANAIRRAIQILKERECDESWSIESAETFEKIRNGDMEE